ncbi:hypothetical protein TW95_gp1462 [Pandoravirus inopinatum]|uniref:Uncharacterized protein n=1 Tax=Pandoravirus inopinatum TaxID=1605721 RepID=A0A0B5JB42_9VIRU|nr:hypothetical protein TW95_gp1462 [Pandoravirus inopinatum]AJF98196.1 hypothetical protein [Pandoravirus inopinatum]
MITYHGTANAHAARSNVGHVFLSAGRITGRGAAQADVDASRMARAVEKRPDERHRGAHVARPARHDRHKDGAAHGVGVGRATARTQARSTCGLPCACPYGGKEDAENNSNEDHRAHHAHGTFLPCIHPARSRCRLRRLWLRRRFGRSTPAQHAPHGYPTTLFRVDVAALFSSCFPLLPCAIVCAGAPPRESALVAPF